MSQERPVVNLSGDLVALGPLHRELIPTIQRWFNDFDTDRTQGDIPGPRTLERTTAWYERIANGDDVYWYTIYEVATWRPIGMTWLVDIDHRTGTASFGISISEPSARGKGYGTAATQMILDVAFDKLGLHNVSLEVFANNPAGIRAYQKAGFTEYGRIREAYVSGGRRWDIILMEAIRKTSRA